jgi:hypothetical protein
MFMDERFTELVRIRIIQKPDIPYIDGIRLSGFHWGFQYDVNATLGAYLIAQRWATTVMPEDEPAPSRPEPFPHSYEPLAIAFDRRRRRRGSE